MGRSNVAPIIQPDEITCGPSAQKLSLEILGIRKSLKTLIDLCQPTRNGTSTKRMIDAFRKLGIPVLYMENSTLTHLISALRHTPNKMRAVLVSFLYANGDDDKPWPDSGHWAVVSAFSASKNRIYLLDSYSGRRKSYSWPDFLIRWKDYDLKRRKTSDSGKAFRLVRRWQNRPMIVIAKNPEDLPRFSIPTAKVFLPN